MVTTWPEFKIRFLGRFASHNLEEATWNKIETMRIRGDESIEEMATRMQSLFRMLESVTFREKKKQFLRAIPLDVAKPLEKQGVPGTWQETVAEASRLAAIDKKYHGANDKHTNEPSMSWREPKILSQAR